jgi:hypothetical protein
MHSDEWKRYFFSVVVFILPVCLSAHLMIEPLGIIDYLDLVFSYTNIWLKDSILSHSSKS